MSKPIENCPVEEKPIRERAWTAEQLLELADRVETCNRVSVQREAASALRFAATLRQPTNPPEIGSKLVDGAAELAGYVDPEQVADMQKNGGGVSIVSFSERYGRTHPVYYLRAPGGQGGRVDEELVLEGLDYFEKAGDDGDKRYVRAIRAYTNSLQAALAQNAQPKTLGDFVRLPDSERVAIGRQVVDRAIEMQNAQGKAVAYVGDDDDAQFAIPTGAGLKLPAGTPLYLHAEPKNAQGEAVAFFASDPANGDFEICNTLAEAIAEAERMLDYHPRIKIERIIYNGSSEPHEWRAAHIQSGLV